MKFSYILVIRVDKNFTKKVGSLGKIKFKKGFYVYVGSAFLKSAENRILRHLRKNKKKFWHIDYFLSFSKTKIVGIEIFPEKKIECKIAEEIEKRADEFYKKFGCSDCCCKSHLFFFKKEKNLENMLRKILENLLLI